MERKNLSNLLLLILLFSFFSVVGIHVLFQKSYLIEDPVHIAESEGFRNHELSEGMVRLMQKEGTPAKGAAVYLLETRFGKRSPVSLRNHGRIQKDAYQSRLNWWSEQKNWNTYLRYVNAIWGDVRYFPIPASAEDPNDTVTFTDSWMQERSFGGKRGHEGTDLMTKEDIPGRYPVVSMTDGTVDQIGWLPKGGYRIGILAPGGGYFYYAHLDSYAGLQRGDSVKAGDMLGFAGNTGYGPEGTKGQFPTHLHVGIYLYPEDTETSINPYWVLKYLEQSKLTCTYG